MNFSDYVKNRVTEFSCRHGDDVCKVSYEYDIESLEDVIKAFETILQFLGYESNILKKYYQEDDEDIE